MAESSFSGVGNNPKVLLLYISQEISDGFRIYSNYIIIL